jgi:iron(III) transport system substrate-binding protein
MPKTLQSLMRAAALLPALIALATPAGAQPAPYWADADTLKAAKAEGSLTVYSSMNEQEGLPFWKLFEDATGIKVEYVRANDVVLIGRISIERRAQQKSWDVLLSPAVTRLPADFLQPIDPPEAKALMAQGRDPNKRWYGVYANYDVPQYNTKLVKPADLPKSYEDFLTHKEWAGKIAIDQTDTQWLKAVVTHYGEQRGRKLVEDIVATLNPILVDGHLALARSVAAGEYPVALNNYMNLTINQMLTGGPTDYWALDPVAVFFGSVGVNTLAPHPKAALLAANFALTKEAQSMLPKAGRLPVRTDVTPNPPDALKRLDGHKLIVAEFPGEEEKKWQRDFQQIFRRR